MMGTSDIDYCVEEPKIVVRVGVDWNSEAKAEISTDGTETWTNITFTKKNDPSSQYVFENFGHVAVSSTKNPQTGYPSIVMIPSGHVPVVSDDLGQTWTEVTGITDTTICTQYWNKGRHLASDKADGATFYIQDRNNSSSNRSKVYVSRDWGHTWSNPSTLGKSNVSWHIDKTVLKAAPYMKNVVWTVTGDRLLYQSVNGGDNFYPAPDVTDVECFGFGKNAPDRENPTAYLYGRVSGVMGIYRSLDMGKTWCRLDADSAPPGCAPSDIQGDMQSFGVVYLATGGRGIFYGEPKQYSPEPLSYTLNNIKCGKYSNSSRSWISFQASVTRDNEQEGNLFVAAYDSEGRLSGIFKGKVSDSITSGGTGIYSCNILVQSDVKTVKAFVWNSAENMKPVSDKKIYTFDS